MQKSNPNVSNVSSSSLVDLKAELFRKQEEFNTEKVKNQNVAYIKGRTATTTKRPNLFSKKNAGVESRATKDFEERVEEDNVLERSKKCLERKTRLYEEITSGKEVPEEDGSGLYLVDFQKKVIDDVIERRELEHRKKEDREKDEAEEEQRMLLEPVPPAEEEDDEWVDYTDSFGRSRRCLRRDLPSSQKPEPQDPENISLLSSDMRRELERQRWEKEAQETLQKDSIHYADVQHNEIRTHGVGFYQFSREEREREEQMESLQNLRHETKIAQTKRERIKEKRKAALAARLAKVKQRRREKAGVTGNEEDEKSDGSDGEIGPAVSEMSEVKKEPQPLTRDNTWRSQLPNNREWDKGKQAVSERTEQLWIEKQRKEREEEFAPPSFYYEEKSHPSRQKSQRDSSHTSAEKEFHKNESNVVKTEVNYGYDNIPTDNSVSSAHTSDTNQSVTTVGNTGYVSTFIQTQLKKLRQEVDSSSEENVATFGHSNTPFMSGEVVSQHWNQHMNHQHNIDAYANCRIPPTDMSMPPPNVNMPPLNVNMPPLNVNMPPPNVNMPPLNVNMPPLNVNMALPNVNMPPLNVNMPPPNVYMPPPMSMLQQPVGYVADSNIVCTATISDSSVSGALPSYLSNIQPPPPPPPVTASGYVPLPAPVLAVKTSSGSLGNVNSLGISCGTSASAESADSSVVSRPKFVPKMSIVDTRLMMNEDDD